MRKVAMKNNHPYLVAELEEHPLRRITLAAQQLHGRHDARGDGSSLCLMMIMVARVVHRAQPRRVDLASTAAQTWNALGGHDFFALQSIV